MTTDDIDFAIAMTDFEDWGNVATDFERLIQLEPQGCFIARDNNERVGMITTTSRDDYAFMGSLIIREGYRRRGIGKALMHEALAYLNHKNISCVELDATFEGVPLYRKLGFRDKFMSYRQWRPATPDQVQSSKRQPFSLDGIIELDKRLTGLNRQKLITSFVGAFRESVYISRSPDLNGYAIVFPRKGNLRAIGPVIAESEDVAKRLLDEVIENNCDSDLLIGLLETAGSLLPFLLRHGFEYCAPTLRMYRGEYRRFESSVYAIVSPEKG
jgi:GNAT superfamily N-acetyltransferase